jgi:hypothetical protein
MDEVTRNSTTTRVNQIHTHTMVKIYLLRFLSFYLTLSQHRKLESVKKNDYNGKMGRKKGARSLAILMELPQHYVFSSVGIVTTL